MKRYSIIRIILLFQLIILGGLSMTLQSSQTDFNITSSKESTADLSYNPMLSGITNGDVKVISDGYQNIYWNLNLSADPAIAYSESGNIFVAWEDYTAGVWGEGGWNYDEIMCANYSAETGGWSNVSVISDGYNNVWGWHNDTVDDPDITFDKWGNIHVVWGDDTDGAWGTDSEIMYVNYSAATNKWSNITILSDGPDENYGWNNDTSDNPAIVVDDSGNIHVVWDDSTEGPWTSGQYDSEIMYVNYSAATKTWSNITVISDGPDEIYGWNDDESMDPEIAIDNSGNIYVIWEDWTVGIWGGDMEIMCANYSVATGKWSNVTILSDGYGGVWGWNNEDSNDPAIAVDEGGNIHVVWEDETNGIWGSDEEIMYAKFDNATGMWKNATVISDGGNWWNDDSSSDPDIDVDIAGNIFVVWEDETNGIWGSDEEIMVSIYAIAIGRWLGPEVVSNDGGWNYDDSSDPAIAVGSSGTAHIVWEDDTAGVWGDGYPGPDDFPDDREIMYVKVSIQLTPPGDDDDDDDDDDDEINIVIPTYVLIGVAAAIGIFCTIVIIIMRKRNVLR